MSGYQLAVGLEVHIQLKTKTKLFCGCLNDPFNAKPNTHICPVCYGLPGALPLLNRKAVEVTVELGQVLKGKITSPTFWARKNYFYPDLPKGYQISQSAAPLITEASLTIEGKVHRIQRIHLEEDAGKLMHEASQDYSLVNFNRAGVPLLELVTYPDFHSSASAKRFCQELQRIVRHLNLSDADMEKGQMRCEANISVSQASNLKSQKLGIKVEVKNINSFRAVEKAIEYEFRRQSELLDDIKEVVQETRTWDDVSGKTVSMRTKETSADYRYFPEPDLPWVRIELGGVRAHKLPEQQRQELDKVTGLHPNIAKVVVDRGLFDGVMAIYRHTQSKDKVAVFVTMAIHVQGFKDLTPDNQLKLIEARNAAGWTKDTMAEIVRRALSGESIDELIYSFGQQDDLGPVIKAVVESHQSAAADYRSGKENALHFLVGQVMAKTQGRANISRVRIELEKALKAKR